MAGLALARRLGDELLVDVGARGAAHIDPIETAKHLEIEVASGHLNAALAPAEQRRRGIHVEYFHASLAGTAAEARERVADRRP